VTPTNQFSRSADTFSPIWNISVSKGEVTVTAIGIWPLVLSIAPCKTSGDREI